MKEQINTLQQAIIDKAEERLLRDIEKLRVLLSNDRLLGGFSAIKFLVPDENGVVKSNQKPADLDALLKPITYSKLEYGLLYKILFEKNREQYIDEESLNFFDNVEKLSKAGKDLYEMPDPDDDPIYETK